MSWTFNECEDEKNVLVICILSPSWLLSFFVVHPSFLLSLHCRPSSLSLLLLVVVNQGEAPIDMSPSSMGHREQPWATRRQLAAHYPELNYTPCCGRSRSRAPGVAIRTPRMDVRAGLDRMSGGQFSKLEGLRVLEHQSEEVNDKLFVLWLKTWNRREGQKQAGIHSGYHQS